MCPSNGINKKTNRVQTANNVMVCVCLRILFFHLKRHQKTTTSLGFEDTPPKKGLFTPAPNITR